MWFAVAAAFLLAHGLIHLSYLTPAPAPQPGSPAWPFHLDDSWGLGRLGVATSVQQRLGRVLALAVLVGFAGAAFGLFLGSGLWRPVAIVAASLSLLQLLAWFHPWLSFGVVIDAAVLAVASGAWALPGLTAA